MIDRLKLDKNTDELKRLIAENPDLPILILANDESALGDGGWSFCTSIYFDVCEYLDCEFFDYDDTVIVDRDRLEEVVEDRLYDDYCDKPEEEYDKAIKDMLAELEPYWKEAIMIYATN